MATIETLCPSCAAINRVAAERLTEGPKCGKCRGALFSRQPQQADDAGFRRLIEKEQLPVVVDFWASWCGPCQAFAPAFSRAAEQLEPMARFVKVDTEKAQQTAVQFGIRSIPTLMVFKDGRVVAQQAGAPPYPEFVKWLHGALG